MPGLEIAYITSVYPVICLPSQNSVMWLQLTVGVAQKWGLAGIPTSEYSCLARSNLKKTLLNLQPQTLTITNLSVSCNFSSCYWLLYLLFFLGVYQIVETVRQLQNLKLMKWVRLFLLFREICISNMYWSLLSVALNIASLNCGLLFSVSEADIY